jgi:RecA-family ATPase
MSQIMEAFGPIPSLEDLATPITAPVREGPPDIIPGLLPRQGQLVIAGETNIGKSLIALEICSSLIMNNVLWGELKPTIQAKRILYVLGEHYNEVIQRLWQHTKLPMNDEVWLLGPEQLGYDKWLVAQGKPNLQSVKKFVKWAEGADLIVFDPFSAFVTGIDVENDNVQMRLVLDTMSLIAQSVGASCIVLAHQGKPQIDKFGQEHSRKSYAIRGASAIEDAATNIFYMGKAEGNSNAAQRLPGDVQLFSLIQRKYKGNAPPEYRLMRDPATLTHTLLGNRPFVEVQKIAAQANVSKIQAAFPNMTFSDAIKVIATIQGCDERTVRRWLEGK